MKTTILKPFKQTKHLQTAKERFLNRKRANRQPASSNLDSMSRLVIVDYESIDTTLADCTDVYFDKASGSIGFGKSYGVTSYNGRPIDQVDVVVIEQSLAIS